MTDCDAAADEGWADVKDALLLVWLRERGKTFKISGYLHIQFAISHWLRKGRNGR
jgi:hypothetical protein